MAETLPQFLMEHAQKTPDKVALRERDYGIWQTITWREYLEHVKYFALGLVHLGLRPEETIAIVGDNRPEWVIAELAAQSVGAKSIGIYQDSVVKEMIYIFNHADVSFIVVEDQEQVDKILEMWPQLQGVRKVIYYDPKGLRNYREDFLMYFPQVEELG
ncbi:MAG: long-chain fatty acid--CoA ligase, partial [Anaerolineae bacterium]